MQGQGAYRAREKEARKQHPHCICGRGNDGRDLQRGCQRHAHDAVAGVEGERQQLKQQKPEELACNAAIAHDTR